MNNISLTFPCAVYLHLTLQTTITQHFTPQTIRMGDRWLGQADISFCLLSDKHIHGRRDPTHSAGDGARFLVSFLSHSFLQKEPVWEGCNLSFFQLFTKGIFSPLVPGGHRGCLKAYMEDDKRITVQSKKAALPAQRATEDQFGWPPPHLILPMATVPRSAAPPSNGPCTRPSAYRIGEFSGLQDFLYQPMCLWPWVSRILFSSLALPDVFYFSISFP